MSEYFEEVFSKTEIFPEVVYSGRASSPRRKKDNHYFSKFWVSILILSIFVYVVAVFYFYWHERHLPDAIHYTFLPAIFVQLTNMMLITRKNKDVEIAQIKYENGGGD